MPRGGTPDTVVSSTDSKQKPWKIIIIIIIKIQDEQYRCIHTVARLASYPGFSQFFIDARRKTRSPDKIDHVRDVK